MPIAYTQSHISTNGSLIRHTQTSIAVRIGVAACSAQRINLLQKLDIKAKAGRPKSIIILSFFLFIYSLIPSLVFSYVVMSQVYTFFSL
jgi:hypothetical protein